jgi:translation initiation factor 1
MTKAKEEQYEEMFFHWLHGQNRNEVRDYFRRHYAPGVFNWANSYERFINNSEKHYCVLPHLYTPENLLKIEFLLLNNLHLYKSQRMDNDWKKRLGVVYSTNEDFNYDHQEKEEEETLPPARQRLIVSLDKKNRKGKAVTLVEGFAGTDEDLRALGKLLKAKCGVGGTVKEGEIMLQGDHRAQVVAMLEKEGYKVKKSGG